MAKVPDWMKSETQIVNGQVYINISVSPKSYRRIWEWAIAEYDLTPSQRYGLARGLILFKRGRHALYRS